MNFASKIFSNMLKATYVAALFDAAWRIVTINARCKKRKHK